jgi:hypothetical protein
MSIPIDYFDPEYVEAVRDILGEIGAFTRSTTQLEDALPGLASQMDRLLQSGIQNGWICRTQIQPDIWRVESNMLIINGYNRVVYTAAGPGVVVIPPNIVAV